MGNAMSFSVTPAEQARVDTFKSMNLVLDPRQAADLIMVIVITVIYFVQLLAVLFMLWNRKYPPIKAKSPWIMMVIFIASIFWFLGDIQINGHAPIKGTPLQNCKALGIWVHILIGICPIGSLIALRSYGLYQVFCRNRPYFGVPLFASIGLLVGALLTFGITVQALSPTASVIYAEVFDSCTFTSGLQTAIFVFVWTLWLIVALISWRIRNIKSSFNETREITITCIIVYGILAFMTALVYAKPLFPLSLSTRILATSLSHLSAMVIWWVPMAIPLYKCLTCREEYLKQWIQKLRQDGLQRAYHVEARSSEGAAAASDDNRSYLHQPVHVDVLNKELSTANANGEFFYAAGNDAGMENATVQMHTIAPGSAGSSRNDDAIANMNHSASNLVQHSQPPQSATRRPWNKLTNVVSASPSTSTLPYSPIINFSQPATNTPQRPTAAPNSHNNVTYSTDGRQLL
ncbi:hypothetical protein GGF42_001844 [Coemansia sp. RSA 2424]|nr:hypothetical protein GGF42_001844 [Coemansia sp. RSA 2424]